MGRVRNHAWPLDKLRLPSPVRWRRCRVCRNAWTEFAWLCHDPDASLVCLGRQEQGFG